jgi:N-acetylmuramoyl-L-alanine amidase
VKKSLNIFLIVLFTIFGIFCADLHSTAYAQETINTPIMGESQATKEQAIQILKTNNSIKTDEYIEEFVDITWEEASIEGVREDIAFSLMMLETGWLKFGGAVAEDQNNFGGIGATDSGGTPASFPDIKTGIRAVVQHLKAYSSTQALNSECVDPRFELVKRGSAEYVEWLGIRENPAGRGWASGQGYGYKIINIINRMCGNNLSPFINKLSASRSDSVYTITAEGINTSEALYRFIAVNTTTGQQTMLQDYNQTNSITWSPSSYGSYQIKAYIKSASSPHEFDAYTTYNVKFEEEQPEETATTIESIKVDKAKVYAGKPFTATAQASSQNKPLYKFWIGQQSSSGNWSWSVIQNYSEKNFVTYTINKPGNYRVSVYVKDSASSKDPEVLKQCDVHVGSFPTTIESINLNKTEVYTGKPFTATAQASSQNKTLYKFWIGQQSSNGNWSWTVIQNYSEKNSVTYTMKKPGHYRVSAYVKDSASSKDPEVLKQCDVYVKKIATIVLDAGHGGSDPGAVSSPNTGQIKEADLNLRLTNILGDLLEEKGFQIIYTRNNKSSNPTLQGRVAIANNVNADLFLSIHHDAAFINKSAHGISTHYSTYRPELDNEGVYEEYSSTWAGYIKYDATPCEAAAKSIILAEDLVTNIANLGFSNRGKFDHNLYVTRMTTMPSVLIEAGFMSNDEEVLRVSDPKMERAIAQKIVETIVDFFER